MPMPMIRTRAVALVSLVVVLPLLSACGGSGAVSTAASNVQSAASQAASVAASAASAASSSEPADTSSPSVSSSSGGVASAADYCGAFFAMQKVAGKGDTAAAVATFRQSAADMRTYAPAEIADSAKAYADILDTVATAIEGHEAKATSTLVKELGANPKVVTDVSTYVAKNCTG